MRTILIFLVSLSILSCKNDEIIVPQNSFSEFNNAQKQNFDIGTVSDTVISGKYGTKVYFSRDILNINDNIPITIELLELYDFIDILSNNIATVTTGNKLLETSGVVFLDIKAENKTIELKENERIRIVFPDKKLKDNFIYYADVDSVGNYKWEKDKARATIIYPDTLKAKQYRVKGYYLEKEISLDSIKYYEEFIENQIQAEDSILNSEDLLLTQVGNYEIAIMINKLGWINLDVPVLADNFLDFNLEVSNSEFRYYHIYILYDSLNSLKSYYKSNEDLSFNKIPIIENTFILITANKDGQYFANQIKLELNDNKYTTELKKVSKQELKDLLIVNE